MLRSLLLDRFLLLLAAMVLLASLWPARGMAADAVDIAADAAITLLFFLHGALLPRTAVTEGLRKWQLHLSTLAATYALFPVIGLLMAHSGLVNPTLAAGILFLTLVPSTVQSSIAFTSIAGGDVAAAVVASAFSNVAGLLLTPLLVATLLMSGSGAGMPDGAVFAILRQLVLPFILGHLLHGWIGAFLVRHRPWTRAVDQGSILLIVYSAFSAAVVGHIWQQVSWPDLLLVAVLASVILALMLGITWFVGARFGFPRRDRIVLLFCGSKKSLASGVPMAGVLFAPAAVGMAILPLMIFHQIQLMACAAIARHLANSPQAEG